MHSFEKSSSNTFNVTFFPSIINAYPPLYDFIVVINIDCQLIQRITHLACKIALTFTLFLFYEKIKEVFLCEHCKQKIIYVFNFFNYIFCLVVGSWVGVLFYNDV